MSNPMDREGDVEKLRDDSTTTGDQVTGGAAAAGQIRGGDEITLHSPQNKIPKLELEAITPIQLPVALVNVADSNSNSKCIDRHCAFCLKLVLGSEVLLCSKCNRRAYCSKECQRKDWKAVPEGHVNIGGNGQGHKFWCGIEYGEEDLDWAVCPIQGKGLGIIALHDIPKWTRIMVEGCQPDLSRHEDGWSDQIAHPGLQELESTSGHLAEKYAHNALDCDPQGAVKQAVCLRMARINHSCNPNAEHIYEAKFSAKILFSEREIKAGEEIRISYFNKQEVNSAWKISPFFQQIIFNTRWGIKCPEDCYCVNPILFQYRKEAEALYNRILDTKYTNRALVELGMRNINKYLSLLDKATTISTLTKADGYNLGYAIGIISKKTMGRGMKFIQMKLDFETKVYHPESDTLIKTKEKIKTPWKENYYGIIE